MSEVIARDAVLVNERADSWSEAIRVAAQPLVRRRSITQSYIDRMVQSVREYGPYIVLMPGFALAHAAPGDDVIRSDLSIALFDNDILFNSDKDPVRAVMCLACVDKQSHVERLSAIASRLLDESFTTRMMSCKAASELYKLLNGI